MRPIKKLKLLLSELTIEEIKEIQEKGKERFKQECTDCEEKDAILRAKRIYN